MSLPKNVRKSIESKKFDTVEEEWLSRLEEAALDLDFFATTARTLDATGADEVAAGLLELLHDQLAERDAWDEQLELLSATGEISHEPAALHDKILEVLGQLYAKTESLEPLLETFGLHRATEDIPKTWEKVERLRQLLRFDRGAIVTMAGKGAGRVVDVNVALGKLKVDFERIAGVSIGFSAAPKVLTALDLDHFLRQKLDSPDRLAEIAKSDPPELLRLLLTSEPDLTATEVRESVAGLVAKKSWSSWWTKARNHPQVVSTGKGARQKYQWAATSEAADSEVLAQFAKADLKQQLGILKRETKRNPEVALDLARALVKQATDLRDQAPASALTILATVERAGLTEALPDWTTDDLLGAASEPLRALRDIQDRTLRRKAFDRLREVRSDWPELYVTALGQEADARILKTLFSRAWEERRDAVSDFVDRLLSQPQKQPAAFVWLMETLTQTPYFGERNPLRALSQLLRAEDLTEFAPHRATLRGIFDDGTTTAELIGRLDEDQAERAAEVIDRSHLEDYLRERLKTALELKFPKLSSGSTAAQALYATRAAIQKRRNDLKALLEEEIPANRQAIEEARALGDLRENFEYKSARQRHEYLAARAQQLENDLKRAQPIDFDLVDGAEVRIGSVLDLRSASGAERQLSVLGPWESDPEAGVISYESDAGESLLGKKAGATIDFEGADWTIAAIHAAAEA